MPGSDQGFAHPRAVLERFQQAAIDKDLTSMVDLYCEDAIHEFPFTRPGLPSRLEGREQIRAFMQANWVMSPLRYVAYRNVVVHETADPEVIVVEQTAAGTSAATGREFALPNIVVLKVRGGRIVRIRDYVNVLAAAEAAGASAVVIAGAVSPARKVRDSTAHHDGPAKRRVPERDPWLLRGRAQPRLDGHERLGRARAGLVAEPAGPPGGGRRTGRWGQARGARQGHECERLRKGWREIDKNLDDWAARRPRERAVVVLVSASRRPDEPRGRHEIGPGRADWALRRAAGCGDLHGCRRRAPTRQCLRSDVFVTRVDGNVYGLTAWEDPAGRSRRDRLAGQSPTEKPKPPSSRTICDLPSVD
jgi:uncharacterized protein